MKKYISYLLCFMLIFSIAIINVNAISADGECVPITSTTVSSYDGLQCTSDSSSVETSAQKLTGNKGVCCASSKVAQDATIGFINIYTNESGTATIKFDAVANSDTANSSSSNTDNSNNKAEAGADAFNICNSELNPNIMAAFKLGSIVLLIIKIIVPIMLIVLGMIDMAKAVVNDNQDAIKKNALIFARRVGTGVLVFLAPTILLAIFNMIDSWDSVDSTYKNCIDCLLDTSKCPKDVSLIQNSTTSNNTDDSNSSSDETTGGSSTHTSSDGVVHGGSSGGF